jgi:uncharacterized Zn-binding protein involved in type VI secretion
MTEQPIALVGSSISHGGAITGGAPDVNCNGAKVARVGDPVHCNIHGAQTIISGSPTVNAHGAAVARQGDSISCGATITGGSTNTNSG